MNEEERRQKDDGITKPDLSLSYFNSNLSLVLKVQFIQSKFLSTCTSLSLDEWNFTSVDLMNQNQIYVVKNHASVTAGPLAWDV